jgi:hypothetical protein
MHLARHSCNAENRRHFGRATHTGRDRSERVVRDASE